MKIDSVKLILSLAISLLLGFLCEIIAPKSDGRNWISFGVGFVTIFSMLLPAMALTYGNVKRGVSIKLFAWIMTVVLVVANVAFALKEYRVDVYLVICLLLSVVGWSVIYALFSAWNKEKDHLVSRS